MGNAISLVNINLAWAVAVCDGVAGLAMPGSTVADQV